MPKKSQSEVENLVQQTLKLLKSGLSPSEVARKLKISLRTVQRYINIGNNPKKQSSPKLLEKTLTKIQVDSLSREILEEAIHYSYPENPTWEHRREEIREQEYQIGEKLLKLSLKSLDAISEDGYIPTRILSKSIEIAINLLRESARLNIVEKLSEPDEIISRLTSAGYAVTIEDETLQQWINRTTGMIMAKKSELSEKDFETLKKTLFGNLLNA